MGFTSGRITYVRFRVSGGSPLPFDEEILDQARARLIPADGPAVTNADGIAVGWGGGDHLLDESLSPLKNILEDALHLGVVTVTDKIPGSLLRAYTTMELELRAAGNPSGHPTRAQRAEAKEAAQVRAQAEAADGRFRKRAWYPILWDGQANVLYAGATTPSALERLRTLFRETFNRDLEPITAGSLADDEARKLGLPTSYDDPAPLALFGEPDGLQAVAWANPDTPSRDVWGNEFLLWLWHTLQADGDCVHVNDGSAMTVMLAKTLTLDCPRGETGRDHLTDTGPTRLPEAFRALQAGKLPRKAGFMLVRHGQDYELTLQAETMAVTGAVVPKPEGLAGRDAQIARLESLRHLAQTMDLLFGEFARRRLSAEWSSELGRIKRWLKAA